ncbi:unnamed protein product [Trichogramma brassicae]|uniref:Uncharacterized protein n=1 Tax=Trichogramma brassicae TaxID=86971 RepID=A0A6H5IGB6_9HYME|nr:unnamed protein product [Trichogramma brassicae]
MWSPRAAPRLLTSCQPPMLLSAAAAAILTILILAPVSRADYQEFLLNEQIEDKLNLLRPANIFKTQWLLEGRDDDHLGRPINASCASDLSLFIRALGNREPWALKIIFERSAGRLVEGALGPAAGPRDRHGHVRRVPRGRRPPLHVRAQPDDGRPRRAPLPAQSDPVALSAGQLLGPRRLSAAQRHHRLGASPQEPRHLRGLRHLHHHRVQVVRFGALLSSVST